jgi:hypothetical protein
MKKIILTLLFSSLILPVAASAFQTNTLIILQSDDFNTTNTSIRNLEKIGAAVRHVLSPRILLCYAPEGDLDLIRNQPGVLYVSVDFGSVPSEIHLSASEQILIEASRQFQSQLLFPSQVESKIPRSKLINDAAIPLRIWKEQHPGVLTADNAREATSSFMLGRASVTVMLMESNGSDENWTEQQQVNTIAEITQGLDRWAELSFDNKGCLTWFYDIHYQVPTGYEPIQNQSVPYWNISGWHFLWMNDALSHLGEQDGWDGMYDHLESERRTTQTDWGFFIFVVMDENDPDHKFTDGLFAYARLEGPYVVMTYNNDGWGIYNMHLVTQHETAHDFGAPDEYADGCGSDDCENSYGFLQVRNGNCQTCNPNWVPCIMTDNQWQANACSYTLGHVGWHDYDSDYWNEAPDRNSRKSQNIWNLSPGDVIDIYNELGQAVIKIIVTPDNSAVNDENNRGYVWNCTNFAGATVATAVYFIKVNGSNRPYIVPDADVISPVISNFSFSNNIAQFSLYDEDTPLTVTRVSIFQDGNEISRPVGDKSLFRGDHQVDLSYLEPGSYTLTIRGWDAGGNAATPITNDVEVTVHFPYLSGEMYDDGGGGPIYCSPEWELLDLVTVPSAHTLTIEPGTFLHCGPNTITFHSGAKFISFGTLRASGYYSQAGGQGMIYFNSYGGSHRLKINTHVLLSNGGGVKVY